tara:strand:- start:15114 stop:15239 length:126 start_codon:yes stop_codon:yes gene_type:complete
MNIMHQIVVNIDIYAKFDFSVWVWFFVLAIKKIVDNFFKFP